MRGGEAVAEILKREGVECVFCFPFTPILDSLAAAGIRPIVARQERVAGNMADGFSRATNGERLGVVTVQQSAGVENAFAGIAQAYTDSSPVLFLPGHPGSQLVNTQPTFDAGPRYGAATKWFGLASSADALPGRLAQAMTALRTGRPRPAMLEVPVDVARQELSEALDYKPIKAARFGPDRESVRAALELLSQAERPMIWAGQGVLWSRASEQLVRFAEQLALPVMTTLMGKSGFPEDHPLSLGTGGFSMTSMAASALAEADVVFALGASLARDFTAPPIPGAKRLIHNTVDALDLNLAFRADVPLLGDARLTLEALLEEAGGASRERGPVEALIAERRGVWQARWQPLLTSDEVPINPYRVIADFMETFDPDDIIVTHESGGSRDQLVPIYQATSPRGYIGWGHSTQLGFSLGCAMGAKLACPDKLVVNFMGDAAFGMVGMDLETAVREKIPIMTVLLNNQAMGNYEKNIPVASERFGTKYLSGDYQRVASGLGAWSERVDDPTDLVAAFERAHAATREGRPAVLEVMTKEEPEIAYWYTYPELRD